MYSELLGGTEVHGVLVGLASPNGVVLSTDDPSNVVSPVEDGVYSDLCPCGTVLFDQSAITGLG